MSNQNCSEQTVAPFTTPGRVRDPSEETPCPADLWEALSRTAALRQSLHCEDVWDMVAP